MSWKDVTVMSERVKFVVHREPWGERVTGCLGGTAVHLEGMIESSFVSPRRACVGKEQRVVPEVWADFAEIGCPH